MNKKLAIVLSILIVAIFSFSVCFANDMVNDAVEGVRNVVGGAENAVEDAAGDVSNATKDATNTMGNMAQDATNSVGNMAGDTMNRIKTEGDNDNTAKDTNNEMFSSRNGNYTATRTNAEGSTLMGMNATMWTWLIIGIAAIAIVALVWYYSMQMRSSNYDDKD